MLSAERDKIVRFLIFLSFVFGFQCSMALKIHSFFLIFLFFKQQNLISAVSTRPCACSGACNCPISVLDDTESDSDQEEEEDQMDWEV